jgi:hypothetical protein
MDACISIHGKYKTNGKHHFMSFDHFHTYRVYFSVVKNDAKDNYLDRKAKENKTIGVYIFLCEE